MMESIEKLKAELAVKESSRQQRMNDEQSKKEKQAENDSKARAERHSRHGKVKASCIEASDDSE